MGVLPGGGGDRSPLPPPLPPPLSPPLPPPPSLPLKLPPRTAEDSRALTSALAW
jgi:hypothetical protein